MEEYSSIPMARTGKIIRTSIFTFLQKYQYFTTVALFALPFSASILLSQSLVPTSSLLPSIQNRLRTLFFAAGFPPLSEFFAILNFKLSQTVTSSVLVLPFTLTFLLITKASVIHALNHHKPSPQPSFSSFVSLHSPLLLTQLCNSFVILSANATCFSLLFIAFNCVDGFNLSSPTSLLFLSATGAVFYSIILANALVICNLALVLSGMEKRGGFISILKACVLIRGRTATALSLALPVNMAMAAVEALFQFRVAKAYYLRKNPISSMAIEGIFIAYMYSILIVLDTITSCVFFKSCRTDCGILDQQSTYSCRIEIEEEYANVKNLEELP